MTSVRTPGKIIPRAFPGIKPEEIEEVVANSRVQSYEAGTVLCREGASETTFYMLLEGDVEVTKRVDPTETRLLKTLTAGDFFGEMALIHNAPRAATVTARGPVVVLELEKQAFDRILQHSPSIALAMVRVISNRLRQNDEMAIGDLRVRAAELAEAYQRLAEQELARREFLANVAHELRTPLTAANGYLQVLQQGLATGSALTEAINATARNVTQITSLVNDLLFLQEMELVLPEFQPVDMAELAGRVVSAYTKRADSRRVRLRLHSERLLPPVAGDARSLERALTALVDNAIKFSPHGGDVDIRLLHSGNQVIVTVRDHGIGIDPAVRSRIFDRFYHMEKSGDQLFGGLGLGLAITNQVIQQHKGVLDVDSTPRMGSTFRMALPVWNM
ncbi:MAG: ATP-binding protein [Bacteroidota bacterium]